MTGALLGLVFALASPGGGEQVAPEAPEPPVVGRPADFSGAIGSYRVTMRAQPTDLQAEDPLTLTVRITGSGALESVRRPNLQALPRFAKQFVIEDLTDRYLHAESAREFDYRLRPRSVAVTEIPALPFPFFKPGIVPAHLGYQRTLAQAIPLTVKPRAEVWPQDVQGAGEPPRAPDVVLELVEGPIVLRHEEAWALPGPVLLACLAVAPPFLCTLCYLLWQRIYPDAARRARQRRSRAARQALQVLGQAEGRQTGDLAQWAVSIVVTYLRQRLDLAGAEPTPADVRAHLQEVGAPVALADEAVEFFRATDAARFAPGSLQPQQAWASVARRLILRLEAESWLSQTS